MTFWVFFGVFWFCWFLGELAGVPQLVGAYTPMDQPSEKAMVLLLSWLTPQQLKDYAKAECFYVIGSHTGRKYRINKPVAPFNVECLDPPLTGLCFVPRGAIFVGDIMLAQKIGLETNEEHVLRIANDYKSWPTPPIPVDRLA